MGGLARSGSSSCRQKNWVAEAESLRGPVRAGRFLVHGRHDRGKVPAGRFTLEIDAGLAFGTAHHATTRGCLIALDRLAKREHPRRVLDIGTGTGILAIAAARALNARCDRERHGSNCRCRRRRKCSYRTAFSRASPWSRRTGLAHPALRRAKADLLFANILLRPLLDLAPAFARAVAPGGICVLSGLLEHPSAAGRGALPRPRLQPRIRESFSMDGPPCCCGVAARGAGLRD